MGAGWSGYTGTAGVHEGQDNPCVEGQACDQVNVVLLCGARTVWQVYSCRAAPYVMAKAAQALIYLSADASTLKAPGVTFSRQLWLEQALPDNYTDETFLQSLKISIHGPIRSYWQVVREASAVTQQLDTVVAVATVSAYLYKASNLQHNAVYKACLAGTANCQGSVCGAVHVGLDVSRAPVVCCSGSSGAGWGVLCSSRQSELHHICQACCSPVGPLDSWCISDVTSAADTHQLGQ